MCVEARYLLELGEGPLRARLESRGQERVRDFSWTEAAKKMLDVYRRLGHS